MTRFDRRHILTGAAALALAPLPAIAADEPVFLTGDVVLGAEDAPVTIYEYLSLTCPHCARFHAVTWPEVKKAYVDTGKVKFIMREVYFDQYGLWAAMTARCGDEEKYHWMIDKFLVEQQAWTRSSDLAGAIRKIGRRSGLSSDRLNACLTDRDYAKTLLDNYKSQQALHAVESTPTFIINGEKHAGNMDFEKFSALIEPHLAG